MTLASTKDCRIAMSSSSTNPFNENDDHRPANAVDTIPDPESQMPPHSKPQERPLPLTVDPIDENDVIRFLLSGRVYGYPYTNGTALSNYFRFVINTHPLLSIILHYRLDPYTTKNRFIVFVCILCFAVAVSYLLVSTTFIYQIAVCREGCTSDGSGVCIGGLNNGRSYGAYWEGCQYYRSWMMPALEGVALVVYGSILRFLATCGCLQGRNFFQLNCFGSGFRNVIEFFGGGFLFLFCLLSVAMIVWVLVATYMQGQQFDIFITILITKAWSFGEWFIWTLPYFSLRYSWDKSHFMKKMQAEADATKAAISHTTAAAS